MDEWGRFSRITVITDAGSGRHRNFMMFARSLGFADRLKIHGAVRVHYGSDGLWKGEVGCNLAHVGAIREYLNMEDDGPFLLFEDDCWHMPGVSVSQERVRVFRAFDGVPECDALKLGYNIIHDNFEVRSLGDGFLFVNPVLYAQATVYFREGAQKVVDAVDRYGKLDTIIDDWMDKNLYQVIHRDICFSQYGFQSEIGRHNPYVKHGGMYGLTSRTLKVLEEAKEGENVRQCEEEDLR